MDVYCGIDWAEAHHDITLVNRDGQLLARRRISDDAAGLAQLPDLLAEHGDSPGDLIPVAIETPRGLLVACLRATGRKVCPINPMATARYRDRHSVAGRKSDHGDALVLASVLRTDMHAHRSLPADSELAQAIAVLARAQQDAVWDRTQAHNRLRSHLREYYTGCARRSTACWSGLRRQGRCGTTWPRQIFRCWNSCWALSANMPVTCGRAYGAAIWFSGWMPCGRPATRTRRCRCWSFRPTRWQRSCGTARSGETAPAASSPRSSPARSPPPPAKILNNLLSLLVIDFDEFLPEIPPLPLYDRGRKFPAEVLTQPFIGEPPVCLKAADQPIRVINRTVAAYNCVEGNLVRHQNPSFLKSAIRAAPRGVGIQDDTIF